MTRLTGLTQEMFLHEYMSCFYGNITFNSGGYVRL